MSVIVTVALVLIGVCYVPGTVGGVMAIRMMRIGDALYVALCGVLVFCAALLLAMISNSM